MKRYININLAYSLLASAIHRDWGNHIKTAHPYTPYSNHSDRQDNLNAHVLSLMHDLAVNEHLISTNSVADLVCGVGSSGNLDFTPLAVGGYKLSLRCEVFELLVDALLFNTALSLDQR